MNLLNNFEKRPSSEYLDNVRDLVATTTAGFLYLHTKAFETDPDMVRGETVKDATQQAASHILLETSQVETVEQVESPASNQAATIPPFYLAPNHEIVTVQSVETTFAPSAPQDSLQAIIDGNSTPAAETLKLLYPPIEKHQDTDAFAA